ncbi:MAG: S-methyl-5'-thioadenosine phosphorylase [Propionibacteriaceae bacterium]|jgi:5'-methylthioadenosine phosphorylase|nr:S-methyl-5'-thioadenosine phosphorylase [Propionibacteriaceae bacterium]
MRPDIGIIGGSGFYEFLSDSETVHVETPFGKPSAAISIGAVGGRLVAFIPRHGKNHEFAPHRVNFRANLWALRSLGVRQVLAPCAVGALAAERGPGDLVVPDQVVDRTWGREHTVYGEEGPVVHISFAEPYCPRLRAAYLQAAAGLPVSGTGTLVVINGPRFSTKAESLWHRSIGGTVVGMTGMPEAALARELAMCYATICLVTDHDAGVDGQEAVNHADVLQEFGKNIGKLKELIRKVVAVIPEPEHDAWARCSCRRVLDGMKLPFELP